MPAPDQLFAHRLRGSQAACNGTIGHRFRAGRLHLPVARSRDYAPVLSSGFGRISERRMFVCGVAARLLVVVVLCLCL